MAHGSISGDDAPVRSTVRRVRYLGAARSGTRDYWLMRLTSVALLLLAIAFIWIVLLLAGKDLSGVRAVFSHPLVTVLMLLFVLTSIVHMKLGMQSIIDDYVHGVRVKELALIGNIFFCIGTGIAALFAILRLGGL